MNLRQRFIQWLSSFDQPQNPAETATTIGGFHSPTERFIADEADYNLPITMPEHLRNALVDKGVYKEYLREAARDTYRFQFDTPQRSGADLPVMPTTEDPLREWDFATRKQVLSSCHSAYQRNPLLNSAVQYTADFVIGEGFNLTCKNKQVETFLNDFINHPDNALRAYERQAVIDLQVDGELFLRFFEGEGLSAGQIVVVPMRPWECFWIETEPGFFKRPIQYRFELYKEPGDSWEQGRETVSEYIPSPEILHVAINQHSYELRGRPELYRVLAWARADSEFLQNRARQNHWRGALLWHVKVRNATSGIMAAITARWGKPPTPGTVAIESDNVDITPLQNSVGSSDGMEDGRQIKNRVIMGLRLPEYFFADGYNSNLATAKSQQLPALTKFNAFQTIMIEQVWTPVLRRALQAAIDAGLLPECVEEQDSEGAPVYMTPEEQDAYAGQAPMGEKQPDGTCTRMCMTIDAFEVSYSPLGSDGKLDLANALSIAVDRGWVSNQTATNELGYDYALEQKRIGREETSAMADMAQGRKPPPVDAMAAMQQEPAPDEAPVDEYA